MTSWLRWSERTRALILVAAVLVVGVCAEAQSIGFSTPSLWLPDLIVGVVLAMVGGALWMRDAERVGSMMVAAGAAWFAGNFSGESVEWVAWSSGHLELVHRAIIFSALLTFPLGLLKDGVERVVIVAAFVGVLVPGVARDEWWTIAWATSLFVLFVVLARRRAALFRAGGFQVLPVMAVFSVVLVFTATLLLALGDAPPPRITVFVYQAGVVVTALFLLNRTVEWRHRTVEVADAVVEITFGPGSNVRDLLAEALRDPRVEVVFAIRHDDVSWVDEAGRPAARLSATGRSVVPIMIGGQPVAEVASMVDFQELPGLFAAVASATGLAADHARLRADLRREIDALAASRLRLLSAADRERAELAEQLEREASQTLGQIRGLLEGMATRGDHAVDAAAARSMERLEGLERDLDSLAAGLGPAALTNGRLQEALEQLDGGGNVAVSVAVAGPVGAMPAAEASTIYFVCAEGIANAVKHATATHVCVTLESTNAAWVLQVVDDGRGGADMSNGSGLQSLNDRVRALGGWLRVESPVGGGTRLTVELPRG